MKKKFDSSKIIISMVINRFNEEFNRKAQTFNTAIKAICKNLKVLHLFHNNIKVQMKCFFLLLNLKEKQKSGRSPFTVS